MLISLDTHPLIREYFAKQVSERAFWPFLIWKMLHFFVPRISATTLAWRTAHRRLYEHLCKHKEGKTPTLEDLQPLYQAVAHGCHAGLQQKVFAEVYRVRITKYQAGSDSFYAVKTLGALGSELSAISCFFEKPWSRVAATLSDDAKAWLLNQASYLLRSLGRSAEAIEPLEAGLNARIERADKTEAWRRAGNLSELKLTLGEVGEAKRTARRAVTLADRSTDNFGRLRTRANLACAWHHVGHRSKAVKQFQDAEAMQVTCDREHPRLYTLLGFWYCDALLADVERSAWALLLGLHSTVDISPLLDGCKLVSERARQTLQWEQAQQWLLPTALDQLTVARAELYTAILESGRRRRKEAQSSDSQGQGLLTSSPAFQTARSELDAAVSGLRRAGNMDEIPRGLLTRAWFRFLDGKPTGTESAQEDLDEAWRIAERGPMRLYMADIHLYRVRLFGREKVWGKGQKYPWEEEKNRGGKTVKNRTPKDDLDDAEYWINKCGYHRRDEELADAKEAIKNESWV
jgi:tetratricopeptide (TPR) repeat protein